MAKTAQEMKDSMIREIKHNQALLKNAEIDIVNLHAESDKALKENDKATMTMIMYRYQETSKRAESLVKWIEDLHYVANMILGMDVNCYDKRNQ